MPRFTRSIPTSPMCTFSSNRMPRFVDLAWCERCRVYHPDSSATGADESVSSRTRSRRAIGRLGLPTLDSPSAVPVPEISDADDSDDSEDSDYDPDTDSDASSVDSANYEDGPITEAELDRLRLPLDVWERVDVEDHVPLEVARMQFPETCLQTRSGPPAEKLCPKCGNPLHNDDWLDPSGPDADALEMSGDYCEECLRLKPDFKFRAGFCNCRCTCPEEADNPSNSDKDSCDLDEDDYDSDLYFVQLVYALEDMNSDTSDDEGRLDLDPHAPLR